jgi:maltooligosyltrehalose trehalohydrolase
MFVLDGSTVRPDPASCLQPLGVHGASETVDHNSFPWRDGSWRGLALEEMVIYEIHTGTFTGEGTFDAMIERLGALRELGVNAIELMPVAQFPGGRNWGYDGTYPFAVQNTYGGPDGLKRLVDACHLAGMAVILDVVYNHLGPEGNYLWDYGHYFTNRYMTPWGDAVNFDGPYSDEVRRFFIQNALHWFARYHIDGLRIDAVHSMHDESARPFLRQLSDEVGELSRSDGRRRFLIAESDLNDSRLIRSKRTGGFGLDAQWCDDFHHSIHAILTGERTGYHEDFGDLDHLVMALRKGYAYCGEYSRFRKKSHGDWPGDLPVSRYACAKGRGRGDQARRSLRCFSHSAPVPEGIENILRQRVHHIDEAV